jgi:tRNA pseudouridine13 synthase
MFEIPSWPRYLGPNEARGVIRQTLEDFQVEEIPRIQPDGEGSHLWLWVEKRDANTDFVASQLARAARCPRRDVGYAGLKDRRAVTRQWFSVPASESLEADLAGIQMEGVAILEKRRHTRKLKTGTLDGNRFRLLVRDFQGDIEALEKRLEMVRTTGVPNYFGPQRFGHNGANVERGFRQLSARARLPRNKKSIYLSAMRSFLFNHVLAERVHDGSWNRVVAGEVAMLDGTHSIFTVESVDAEIEDRCRRHDIHPSGPLFGDNGTDPGAKLAELEDRIVQQWPMLCELLIAQRMKAARRALRLIPKDLAWRFDRNSLELEFVLPAGAYATTILRELIDVEDAGVTARNEMKAE